MSNYEVRFIKDERDVNNDHIVVEVEASHHDEALQKARDMKKGEIRLAEYSFWSVAITRR